MKEIILSVAAIAVIGVAAAYGLKAMDWSAQSKFTTEQGSVRLD